MTVKELIEHLKKVNQDSTVLYVDEPGLMELEDGQLKEIYAGKFAYDVDWEIDFESKEEAESWKSYNEPDAVIKKVILLNGN